MDLQSQIDLQITIAALQKSIRLGYLGHGATAASTAKLKGPVGSPGSKPAPKSASVPNACPKSLVPFGPKLAGGTPLSQF